ncbi:DUF4132 domain-containing protein [Acinetobacter puyangensis]|uniref:DUF4132 domain-containing protein n=1 Tax=Acinetobacter puyangensis TaxID=1096779 RepID=UPI003A4DD187
MFENLMHKLGQLINPKDQVTLDLLHTLVAPLAEIDQNLPEQALSFIIDGQHAEILLTLQQQPNDQASALLGNPGTYSWYWASHNLSKAQEKLVKAGQNARYKLYIDIFEKLTAEQIIRYGKLLAAVTQQKNFKVLYEQTPVWFTYLIVDGLVTTLSQNYGKELTHRQHWTLEKLQQLLASDITNADLILIATLFERKEIDRYHHNNLHLIHKLADSSTFLQQRGETLQSVIPSLSANGQVLFLEFAKNHLDLVKQFPQLIIILALSSSKTVREAANSLISQLDSIQAQQYLQHYLNQGDTKQRAFAADLLARSSEDSRDILQQALDNETQKSVQQSIQSALQRLDSLQQIEEEDFIIPELQPLASQDIPDSFIAVLQENYQAILEKARLAAEQEIEDNKAADRKYKYDWQQKNYKDLQKISTEQIGKPLLASINGKQSSKNIKYGNIILYQKKIQNYTEYGLHHALRLINHRDNWINWESLFSEYLQPHHFEHLELRQLAHAMQDVGFKNVNRLIAAGFLENSYYNGMHDYIQRNDQIVPFFVENLDFIAEALGLLPNQSETSYRNFEASNAITVLSYFPHIPKQFIPRLLELALGENKRLRFDAQELLQTVPNIHERALEALQNGKQEIRITAIEWLARLQHADAIPALYALLKKEKKEIVIAAILTALEQLGEDISSYLSPSTLQQEAEKGLKGKIAASFSWFDLDSLPSVQWQDGSPVDSTIIKWWVVLADKLKDPVPNALLQRYLSLLDEKSQQVLSLHLLQSFIQQDTRHPSLEEASAIAINEAPARLQNYRDAYQRWGKQYPEYYGKYATITLEEVIEEIKRERMGIYLGSAIKSKGMLALTYKAQSSQAVKLLQDYMKYHYQRRAQIEAMLSSFSISDDPLIIQLLLGLSRRYRTTSVQNLAKQLVEQIAERNHWSSDELADRTIPTAGLDDTGILTLDYGTRSLTAYVDDKDKFVLKNEDGKIIKALPTARQGDDEALIKEAKSLFSNSKKEFKQVVELQTQRLYEAMCSERVWSSADWQEYLFAHPIMKRLIQLLVWLEVDSDGQILHQFRPSDDGSLLDLEDDEIELQTDSQIKLAHIVLISQEQATAWQNHFKDYKIKPLFDQMSHQLPGFDDKAQLIDDHKGWLTDTFTLRGVITKLGYQRASIEDGGSFDSYYKPFSQIGISAVINFSGSYVPEENIPAVLYELGFDNKTVRSWREQQLQLSQVLKVLLAECYADYLKVAAACSGFDPEWQKKTPW